MSNSICEPGVIAPSAVGIPLGCFSIAGVAGPLLIGRIADRGQNHRLLLLLVLTASIVFLLPFHFVSGLWWGIPLVSVFGLAARSTGSLTDAFVGRIIADPLNRYGSVRVWGSLGFITASLFLQATRIVDGKSALSILLASPSYIQLSRRKTVLRTWRCASP